MKLQMADLTTERQGCAATGYTQAQFDKLLTLFTCSYLKLFGQPVAVRQAELEITPTLTSERELLFFTLFSLKAGLTYDLLGFVSGMDASNAKRNQQLGLDVLQATLTTAQCLPRRKFKDATEFKRYVRDESTVIFDGLEQRMQRPHENEVQRDFYCGKKSVIPSKR